MPVLPVLATTTDIGYGIHTPHFKPSGDGAAEAWTDTDIEATVGVENGRCGSIELRILTIGDDHGDASAVF